MEAKAHSAAVFRRIGWRQLIITLLESGWITTPGHSPLEAVQRYPFADALRLISLSNARI